MEIPTETLLGLITDEKVPLQVRLAALKKLGSEKPAGLTGTLADLTADKDATMRSTALQTLGTHRPGRGVCGVGRILASGKPSDKQLSIILLGNLSHPEAPSVLLDLVKDLENQPPALRLDILDAASKRKDPALKEALAAYEAGIDKDDPLAAFGSTLEGGSVRTAGRIFFRNGSANCVQCHKVGNRGGEAGPNLEGIASRQNAAYILESIVNPGAKLAPGYSAIAVTMNDGSVVAGMLMKETETEVIIRNPETDEQTVCKKSEIKTMPPAISTMPPMGLILSKSQIRDLMAFMSSLK